MLVSGNVSIRRAIRIVVHATGVCSMFFYFIYYLLVDYCMEILARSEPILKFLRCLNHNEKQTAASITYIVLTVVIASILIHRNVRPLVAIFTYLMLFISYYLVSWIYFVMHFN